MKYSILIAIILITGCTIGPYKMYDSIKLPTNKLTILPINGEGFRINSIDNERVGNFIQGQMGLTEIHIKPGIHKFNVGVTARMENGGYGSAHLKFYAKTKSGAGYGVFVGILPDDKVYAWMEDKYGRIVSSGSADKL
jgi:hypothetical protein